MKLDKKESKLLILSHYTFGSPESEDTWHRVLRGLKDKVQKGVLIVNPFPEFGSPYAYCVAYENGEKVRQLNIRILRGPAFLQYAHHILIIYYCFLKFGLRYDLCIALENFSFIAVYPLKFFGLIQRHIYYTVDFLSERFSNPVLNRIYHVIDKFACQHSDANWVMVEEQLKAKLKYYNISRSDMAPFAIVPIGYERKIITVKQVDEIDFYGIVYTGVLLETMGVQLIIEAMPLLIKQFPRIHLTIIGSGKYGNELKKLVDKLQMKEYVNFAGFIESFIDLTSVIAKNSLAVAPYVPITGGYKYLSDPRISDPSKIKLYMCCGLPVITTNVTTMAKPIIKTKSGIVIDYAKEDLAKAIGYLLSSRDRYKLYKEAAIKLSEKFDMNQILKRAIKKIS